jgi:FKBP-type peptidyl-prolyl cis-trans isomerase
MTRDDLDTIEKKASYLLGVNNVRQMMGQGIELDMATFIQGAQTAFDGEAALYDGQEAQAIFDQYQQVLQAKQQEAQSAAGADNAKASAAFLAANAGADGVQATASGLQYRVMEQGSGETPVPANTVRVHYEGKLIDGTVFDSSFARGEPTEFGLTQVISGWTEGLQLMPVGSTFEFFIPSELAYGPNGPPSIGPNQALIFKVQLIDIVG